MSRVREWTTYGAEGGNQFFSSPDCFLLLTTPAYDFRPFLIDSIIADSSPITPKCSGRIPAEPDVTDDVDLTST